MGERVLTLSLRSLCVDGIGDESDERAREAEGRVRDLEDEIGR